MNNCFFSGNVGSDPKVTTVTAKDNTKCKVATFSFAARDDKSGKEDWIFVECWRKTAEYVEKNLHKGDFAVLVSCKVRCKSFEDKDGNTVYRTSFECSEIERRGKTATHEEPSDSMPEDNNDIPESEVEDDFPFKDISGN